MIPLCFIQCKNKINCFIKSFIWILNILKQNCDVIERVKNNELFSKIKSYVVKPLLHNIFLFLILNVLNSKLEFLKK